MERFDSVRWGYFPRFCEILKRHGAKKGKSDLLAVFTDIVKRYGEPHRFHHNNRHVMEIHMLLDLFHPQLENSDVLFIAAEGHDLLPSEIDSALLMGLRLWELGVDDEFALGVGNIIESTIPRAARKSSDEHFLHDADFWILASPRARYREYSVGGIWREFKAKEHPDWFFPRRRRFLETQLAKSYIFETAPFQQMCEASAQENIRWELDLLKKRTVRTAKGGE